MYREPQLLTKLIHQWLLNHDFNAAILPCRPSRWGKISADLIRLGRSGVEIGSIWGSIVVYAAVEDKWENPHRVKVDYGWPHGSLWLNHNDPDFFGELEQVLECGGKD